MPGCVLSATGVQFDVDEFMKGSTWQEFASVFHRGDATLLRTRPVLDSSGLEVAISDSDEDALEPQIRDAMEFLEQERAEIQRLAAFPGVEFLEFRIGLFWCQDTLCQFHTLRSEFLRAAGDLGVAVTLCVYGVSSDEEEAPVVAEPGVSPNSDPAPSWDGSEVSGRSPSAT